MRNAIVMLVLATLWPNVSEACQRCGLFGNRCRYVAPVVQKQVVANYAQASYVAPVVQPYVAPTYVPAQQYQPPALYVTNVYPQANGQLGLLADQGKSQYIQPYTLQQAVSSLSVNPSEMLQLSGNLLKASQEYQAKGWEGWNQQVQAQIQLNSSIAEVIARGNAAAQVLGAAGLSQQTGDSVRAEITATVNNGSQHMTSGSVLASRCAKCHGVTLTEPKGGVFLDAGHQIDSAVITQALEEVMQGRMPPGQALSVQEKNALLQELLSLKR